DLALSIASYLPGVEATVWINGCANTLLTLYHKKSQILPALMMDISKMVPTESGAFIGKNVMHNLLAEENKATLVLNKPRDAYMDQMVERLQRHYLEPPYGPYCPSSFHGVAGKPVLWGLVSPGQMIRRHEQINHQPVKGGVLNKKY
uniref:BAAT/Acyl-CoA thioester hydrolase C-terminal domain-containing protein n=1 Tax=Sander lucioperca TaxID=283035 RepID=A0A8C9Z3N5_SANLU